MKPDNSQPEVTEDDADVSHSRPANRKAKRDPSGYSAFADEVNRMRAGDFTAAFAQQERP